MSIKIGVCPYHSFCIFNPCLGPENKFNRIFQQKTYDYFFLPPPLKVGSFVLRFQHYCSSLNSACISSLQIPELCGKNQPTLNQG
jgi:hypothetical protein